MAKNQDLIQKTNNVLSRIGVTKDVGGSLNLGDVNFGNLIPEPEVRTLINETKDHSAFLQGINQETRRRMKGNVPIYELEGAVMEYVGEQDTTTVTTRPATRYVPYTTKKHKADIVLSTEELREMAEAEVVPGDFEQMVVNSFTTQLSNNVTEAVTNGNRALLATTRTNRMLRGVDGIDVLTDAGANVYNFGGKAFTSTLFDAIRDRLPWKYRRNRALLRWMFNDRVHNYWQSTLAQVATPLGDQAKISREMPPPLGIAPLDNPYITEEDGPAAIAPTGVADNTTYITVDLTTLVTAGDPATVAAGVGRRFLVTFTTLGKSEYCTAYNDGGTLKIDTIGLLGQVSVDTDESNYTVRPADETDIYLCNPKAITLVWCTEWRTARQYNQHADQIEITIYLEFDVVIPIPEAIVKLTNVAIPPIPLA